MGRLGFRGQGFMGGVSRNSVGCCQVLSTNLDEG